MDFQTVFAPLLPYSICLFASKRRKAAFHDLAVIANRDLGRVDRSKRRH
jgi:hypothetical protein